MRNNPGGLLRAGLDVARLWLDGEAAVFNVQGRDEDGRMAVTQVRRRMRAVAGPVTGDAAAPTGKGGLRRAGGGAASGAARVRARPGVWAAYVRARALLARRCSACRLAEGSLAPPP